MSWNAEERFRWFHRFSETEISCKTHLWREIKTKRGEATCLRLRSWSQTDEQCSSTAVEWNNSAASLLHSRPQHRAHCAFTSSNISALDTPTISLVELDFSGRGQLITCYRTWRRLELRGNRWNCNSRVQYYTSCDLSNCGFEPVSTLKIKQQRRDNIGRCLKYKNTWHSEHDTASRHLWDFLLFYTENNLLVIRLFNHHNKESGLDHKNHWGLTVSDSLWWRVRSIVFAPQVFVQSCVVSCHCGLHSTVVHSRVCHCSRGDLQFDIISRQVSEEPLFWLQRIWRSCDIQPWDVQEELCCLSWILSIPEEIITSSYFGVEIVGQSNSAAFCTELFFVDRWEFSTADC